MPASAFSARSRSRRFHWWGYGLVTLLSFAVLAHFVPDLLRHPNHYFLEKGGDGIQSYFATSYYSLYDRGVHFSGMNYPGGEHFNYPNLQPLIAYVLGWLQRHGVPAARYTIGITNLLALLAVALTPAVLYAVLRRFRLPVGYSILLALIISYLSPQLLRLGGHTSLSYPFFVPLLWYYIIRMQEAPRQWRWYVWFAVVSLLEGAVMPYFMAAGSLLLLAHVLVLALRQRPFPTRQLGSMVLAALLPLLLFRTWLWMTDHATDRPPNPYGVLVYVSSPGGVFTPLFEPLRTVSQAIWRSEDAQFEGQSYIGLVVVGVLAATVLAGVWYMVRRRHWRWLLWPALPAPLVTALWASGLLLLYSFGLPFKIKSLTWLLDYSGPLKQFRSLGRFAWAFYYVAGVYAAYFLYRLWRYQRRRGIPLLALPWLPLLLALWAGEAWQMMTLRAAALTQASGAEEFLAPDQPMVQQLSWANRWPADFQAILPLPYYNKGSDKIDLDSPPATVFEAERLACATGLPLLATYVSRPSVEQMLRHVQLLSGPLIDKPLLRTFPSAKPILLLVANNTPLTPAEARIVALGQLLMTPPDGRFTLYELPLAALAATTVAEEAAKARTLLPTLPVRPGGLRVTTPKGVILESFDQRPNRRGRLAVGALHEPADQMSTLYSGPLPTPGDTGRYEVGVWINGKTDYGCGSMQVRVYRGTELLDQQGADGRLATEIDGDWIRVVTTFRRPPGADRIEVFYFSRDMLADDLLIRPLDTDVYYYVGEGRARRLVKNTYILGTE